MSNTVYDATSCWQYAVGSRQPMSTSPRPSASSPSMVVALEDTPLGYGANDATKSMDDGAGGGEAARARGGLPKTTTATTLQLGALLGLWHLFSIYNKQVLKVFPFPMNITTVQYAVGTVIALIMWTTGILERPKLSGAQVAAILPLAIVHTLCNLFTNMSSGKVIAVSFTHVSKSNMEPNPSLSVLLSRKIILGQFLIPWVVLCLVQIATAFQSRKVLRGSLGAINLFSVITLMSFFLLAPATFLTEGVKVTPAGLHSLGLNLKQIYTRPISAA